MMTPRPYLSYSQMILLERSPKAYRRTYIEGAPSFSNKEMSFGSIIGKLLENDESSGDPAQDFVLSQIPRYDLAEHDIYALVVAGNKTVPLIAKPDSIKVDYSDLLEYKTGRNAWTQAKVDKDSQLTFYSTTVWLSKKRIPGLKLVWIETEIGEDGKVRFTGKIKIFETKRNMGDILSMQKRMLAAWDEIKKMTEEALV